MCPPSLKNNNKPIIENVQRQITKKIIGMKGLDYEQKLMALTCPVLITEGQEGTWLKPSRLLMATKSTKTHDPYFFVYNSGIFGN